jgi:hypothetical protein
VAARLALLATRPSGPVSTACEHGLAAAQAAWPLSTALRAHRPWSPRGGAAGAGRQRPERGEVSGWSTGGKGGGTGQGGRGGDSPMCIGAGEVAGKGGPTAFVTGEDPVMVSGGWRVLLQVEVMRGGGWALRFEQKHTRRCLAEERQAAAL